MFSTIRSMAALTVGALALSSLAFAQHEEEAAPEATLKVGMPAPALTVEKWIKGAPVASFEKGKVYVIEFWATWCGPCIAQMPHLSQIQRDYKDKGVTVIGLTSADESNTLAAVEKMVGQKGDAMGYTVAWDKERATNTAFMEAAAQNGIPCSFLIDKTGTVAYIGHPMMLDMPLAEVVAGTWDIAKGAEKLAKLEEAMNAVYELADGDPKAALAKFAEFEKAYPMVAAHMATLKLHLMLSSEDYDGAYAAAVKLVDHAIAARNASELGQLAWMIVDPQAPWTKRDTALALRAATEADKLAGGTEARILHTLARCHAANGDFKKAVEVQTKAVEISEGRMKEFLSGTLEEYKQSVK